LSWLLLAALGMIWAAFLLPAERWKAARQSVEDFDRDMGLLAETNRAERGRWIVTPQKGVAFVGSRAQAQARARARRRQVLIFLLECTGVTFLIGLVPPLRVMWSLTFLFVALLTGYIWMLVSMKERSSEAATRRRVADASVPKTPQPARQRYVSEGRVVRPSFNGLGALGADDLAGIVVRPAREVGMARV
jgi:Flp pilus assembly protein TadB